MVKTLIFVVMSLTITNVAFAEHDYCKEEAVTYLKQKFGEQAEALAFTRTRGNKQDIGWKFWVRTNLCSGYFVYDYGFYKDSACTIVRYHSPQMLYRVYAHGQCKELLPKAEYPKLND